MLDYLAVHLFGTGLPGMASNLAEWNIIEALWEPRQRLNKATLPSLSDTGSLSKEALFDVG